MIYGKQVFELNEFVNFPVHTIEYAQEYERQLIHAMWTSNKQRIEMLVEYIKEYIESVIWTRDV